MKAGHGFPSSDCTRTSTAARELLGLVEDWAGARSPETFFSERINGTLAFDTKGALDVLLDDRTL